MSEDNLINLEDDGAASVPAAMAQQVPEATAPAPEAPPADVVPPEAQPAEVESVDVGGQKYVPLAAVLAERSEKRALKEKAARADALEQYVNESRPYVEFLKNNPQLLQPRQPDPVPSAAPQTPPADDPETLEAARLLDFYMGDGSGRLDATRGAKLRAMIRAEAEKIADSRVKPIYDQTYQSQSQVNFQRALQLKDPNGRSPSEASLRQIWQTVGPEITADPRAAGILAMTALGIDAMGQRPIVAPPASAPLMTEASGGTTRSVRPLSDLERKLAAERRVPEVKWQELTKGHKVGHTNVLEDD